MSSIAKNFGLNIILNVSRAIFPLITAPYVSRILGPDGIGLYGFSNTYVNYFILFALLGIPMYGIREIAKCKGEQTAISDVFSQLWTISLLCTIIISLLFIISIFIIPQIYENYPIFFVAGLALFFAPFQIDWYFQGLERFDFITSRTLIIRFISVACIFIFIKEKDDLILYVGITALSIVISNIWNFFALRKYGTKLKFSFSNEWKKHLKPLLYLFSSSIAVSVYVILDTLMLGFISDYSQVGYYTNAMSISRILLFIVTSLSAVAIPRLASLYKDGRIMEVNSLIQKSFSIISLLAVPMTIGLACIAPTFIILFFGPEYKGAVIPMAILGGLIIAIGFNNICGVQILTGLGFDKLFLRSVVIGAILNCVLNALLIPFWGAIGASISSLTAESVILGITYYYVRNKTEVRITGIKSDIFKSLIGSLSFLPICFFLYGLLSGWIYVFTAIIICSISYIIIELLLKHNSVSTFYSYLKLHK